MERIGIFNKIKQALAVIGLKTSDIQIKLKGPSIVAEDESAVNVRKRINKYFDDQQSTLLSRGLVPHSAECKDSLSCVKSPCFKWEPDKIVSAPYLIKKIPIKGHRYDCVNSELERSNYCYECLVVNHDNKHFNQSYIYCSHQKL